ncbi:uncharacterized protein ACNS7B_006605 [Menidia menidia]
MRLSLGTVLCCCVVTSVLLPASGTTAKPNASREKWLKEFMRKHMGRTPNNNLATANPFNCDDLVEPSQGPDSPGKLEDKAAEAVPPLSSLELNVRTKRSGCFLVTCLYHDMVYRVHEIRSQEKKTCAPLHKLRKDGFGRRRRSLPGAARLVF